LPQLDPNDRNVRVFYLLELDEIFRELIAHRWRSGWCNSSSGRDF
jgi:hypothetical protein